MKKNVSILNQLSEQIDLDLFYVVALYCDKIALQGYVTDSVFKSVILKNQTWEFLGTFFHTSFRFNNLRIDIDLSSKSND